MTGEETPKARVRRRRVLRLVWIVPAMAIAVAAYLLWQRMQEYGPEIKVTFADGGGLRVGQTPVRYGVVQKIDLAPNALSADVHVVIYPRFAALVREGSAFWDVSGLNVKAGILKGLEIELESLRSFLSGGIEFASPPGTPRAKPSTVF